MERRPVPNGGKAVVVWEGNERMHHTSPRVGVQARKERGAKITSGRASMPQGLAATCTDWANEHTASGTEDRGLAHESVVAHTTG